jgi:hypothetical protein
MDLNEMMTVGTQYIGYVKVYSISVLVIKPHVKISGAAFDVACVYW